MTFTVDSLRSPDRPGAAPSFVRMSGPLNLFLMAIAVTPAGVQRLLPLCQSPGIHLWVPPGLAESADGVAMPNTNQFSGLHSPIQVYQGSLREHLAQHWVTYDGIVCCIAMGAIVRLIAPLLQDKHHDPAVVVVDEMARHVISVCSGHQGKADELTRWMATQLEATPVLTGSANSANRVGIDVLGRPFGWRQGSGNWTEISAAIARQQTVNVIQEAGATLWQQHLPADHAFIFHSSSLSSEHYRSQPTLWISPFKRTISEKADSISNAVASEVLGSESAGSEAIGPEVPESEVVGETENIVTPHFPHAQWHPRVLWLGIGCERNTPKVVLETAIQQICDRHQLAEAAIAGIATLDLKSDERSLLELCRDRQWPLRCFTSEQLKSITVPNPSSTVEQAVGTASVAEAAALFAARNVGNVGNVGNAVSAKETGKTWEDAGTTNRASSPYVSMASMAASSTVSVPTTLASTPSTTSASTTLAANPSTQLLVPKYVHRLPNQPGAVTVAIAQSPTEYVGRPGKLFLVGMGPGQLDQMTPAAKGAITQADAVIGYSLYLDLIQPLCRPGQIVESLPITQERQRAERAIALAQWGLSVAVVSSGDCGIYGMAGLVMEQLQQDGWDGQIPGVQVFPGVTALQAAAARVGSPLMHDFCAISLSDLLTPWEVIKTRLEAAAQADFVTALYNPKSKTRTQQIAIAQEIFLRYRDPETPVALVRSAYRNDEQLILTALATCLEQPIDMMTVVLIGNRTTRRLGSWLITPRGYLDQSSLSKP